MKRNAILWGLYFSYMEVWRTPSTEAADRTLLQGSPRGHLRDTLVEGKGEICVGSYLVKSLRLMLHGKGP